MLILKEALYVTHNEIKREKNRLSFPIPASSPPSLLSRRIILDVPKGGIERERQRMRRWQEGKKKKNIDRGDKV